ILFLATHPIDRWNRRPTLRRCLLPSRTRRLRCRSFGLLSLTVLRFLVCRNLDSFARPTWSKDHGNVFFTFRLRFGRSIHKDLRGRRWSAARSRRRTAPCSRPLYPWLLLATPMLFVVIIFQSHPLVRHSFFKDGCHRRHPPQR